MNSGFNRFIGLAVIFNAAATLGVIVTITIFYIVGGLWGWINDVLSVWWVLSYLPAAVFLYKINQRVNPPISAAAAAIGIPALLTFAALQILLVLERVRFNETITLLLVVSMGIGIWLLLNGRMAATGQEVPAHLARLTLLFGLAFLLAAGGALIAATAWGAGLMLLVYAGAAVGGMGGLLWIYTATTWPLRFGRWLLSQPEREPKASPGAA